MKTGQSITHVRGDNLDVPVTVTLDQSRTLAGDETWKWVLRKDVRADALVTKISTDATEIEVDASTKQPTIKLEPSDFTSFRSSTTDQVFVHELQMTKDAKVETVMRGSFTLQTDIVT